MFACFKDSSADISSFPKKKIKKRGMAQDFRTTTVIIFIYRDHVFLLAGSYVEYALLMDLEVSFCKSSNILIFCRNLKITDLWKRPGPCFPKAYYDAKSGNQSSEIVYCVLPTRT